MIYTLPVVKDPETGDLILEFPDEMMAQVGWKTGDTVEWIDNKNGSWTIRKKGDAEHSKHYYDTDRNK
jgi:plastocyanin